MSGFIFIFQNKRTDDEGRCTSYFSGCLHCRYSSL